MQRMAVHHRKAVAMLASFLEMLAKCLCAIGQKAQHEVLIKLHSISAVLPRTTASLAVVVCKVRW
jgi:hypothetical protein